jgi:hypothetical protein
MAWDKNVLDRMDELFRAAFFDERRTLHEHEVYELLRLAGRYDNILTRIISWPGKKLQRLTTREPDEQQIEVAIESLKPVNPENRDEVKW